MRRTIVTFTAILLTVMAGSQGARAQGVEELARRGAELFQEGNFREAAIVLREAYDTEPVPVLLYNIARAYQQDGRCYMASDYFERYLATGDTQARAQAQEHEPGETVCANQYSELMASADDALNGGQLERAERLLREAIELSDEPSARIMIEQTLFHLGRCQDARDYINQVSGAIDFTSAQESELERDLARANECIASRECTDMRAGCEERNRQAQAQYEAEAGTNYTPAFIVGGIGAAVLLGAVIHDAVSQSTIDDYETAALQGNVQEFNSLRDDIDSAKTLSWILYGVGGAALITGVVLFIVESGSGAQAPTLEDCTELCWDFGVGTPSGHTGVWVGGTF